MFSTTADFPESQFTGDWRIDDLLEIFIPHTPGMLKSLMAAQWRDGDRRVQAIIESEYFFNHNETPPGLHWRHVKFETKHRGDEYVQSEKITVLDTMDFGQPSDQFEVR